MKGIGSTSKSSAPELSVTVVGVESPSTSGRATPASTGVTSPIHSEDSHGVMSGTGTRGRRRTPVAARTRPRMAPRMRR